MADLALERSERRIITALFADVTDSTHMAERLDPEEWTDIMNEAFAAMVAPVEAYGGRVTRLMGDGLLALFGAPVAHEDDPERAVLAGLRMIDAIEPLRRRLADGDLVFNIRVGINTGLAIVGTVGSGAAADYTAMGDTVNVAARMEQTAMPGTVQVSAATYEGVRDVVEVEPVRQVQVKGKSEPLAAYRVIRHQPGKDFDPPSAFIGRKAELARLRTSLDDLYAGRGAIVGIVGEAGMGKSRLIAELRKIAEARPDDPPPMWLESRGVSYDAHRPYGLVTQRVRQLYRLDSGDSASTVHAAIEAAHNNFPADLRALVEKTVAIGLAQLEDRDEGVVQGTALRQEIQRVMIEGTRINAATAPLVMVFDDLQWTDAASRELIEETFTLVDHTRTLFVCALRPDRRSNGWRLRQHAETEYPHRYTELLLEPLDEEASGALVADRLGAPDVPGDVVAAVAARAEGNPLFTEELTASLIGAGAIVDAEGMRRWNSEYDPSDAHLPETLHALLAARIDALEPATKETLQTASVIGRTFTHDVITALSPSHGIDRHLAELERAMVITAAGLQGHEYTFRHDLTRQAAYESILRKDRRLLHGRLADLLAHHDPPAPAHLHAFHLEQAGRRDAARTAWLAAGDEAVRLSAPEDARSHYAAAQALVTPEATDAAEIIHVGQGLGRSLELIGRHGEALEVYDWLRTIGQSRSDPALRIEGLSRAAGVKATFNAHYDPDAATELVEQAHTLAAELHDDRAMARVYWVQMLIALYGSRDYATAIAHGRAALEIGRSAATDEEMAFIHHDLARALNFDGRSDLAASHRDSAASGWERLGNLAMMADAQVMAADMAYRAGDFERSRRNARKAATIAKDIGSIWLQVVAEYNDVLLAYETAQYGVAISRMEGLVPLAERSGLLDDFWHYVPLRVLLYGLAGDIGAAFAELAAMDEAAHASPTVRAVEAAVLLMAGRPEEALRAIQRPIDDNVFIPIGVDHILGVLEAEVEATAGDAARALDQAQATDALHARAGNLPNRLDTHLVMGVALRRLGRLDQARRTLEWARSRAKDLGMERIRWRLDAAIAEVEQAAGNAAAARDAWVSAAARAQEVADGLADDGLDAKFLRLPGVIEVMRHADGIGLGPTR